MRAFNQRRVRSELPATVFANHDFADFHAIVNDGHGVAWLQAAAAKGRSAVVRHAAIADIANDRANVVDGFLDATGTCTWFAGCGGVDGHDVGI